MIVRILFAVVAVLASSSAFAVEGLPKDLEKFARELNPSKAEGGKTQTYKAPVEFTVCDGSRLAPTPAEFKDKAWVVVSSDSLGCYFTQPDKVRVFCVPKNGDAFEFEQFSETQYTSKSGHKVHLFVGPDFSWNAKPFGPGCVFIIMKK